MTNILEYKEDVKMESNSGTKITIRVILVIGVVFLAVGVLTSITNESKIVDADVVKVATIEEQENILHTNIRNVRHSITDNTVLSRSSTSSRFENEVRKQIEEDEEQARREAEERRLAQIENIKNISISVDMDLTQRTGLTKEEFKMLIGNLKPDTSKFFYDNSDYIYDLCEKYELNEIFFCGLISAESGWTIAKNHRNTYNYISLMLNGKLIRYSSLEEGLEVAAKTLHNKYLTEGGSFYYGKTLSAVRTKFCPSDTWVGLVYGRMNQIVKAKNIEM